MLLARALALSRWLARRAHWPQLEPDRNPDLQAPDRVTIRGTRVDLCVLIEDYLEGHLPEQMAMSYPTLDRESIYGAIAYYLRNRATIDRYVNSAVSGRRAARGPVASA